MSLRRSDQDAIYVNLTWMASLCLLWFCGDWKGLTDYLITGGSVLQGGALPIWINKLTAAKKGVVVRALSLLKLYSLNYTGHTIFHFLVSWAAYKHIKVFL